MGEKQWKTLNCLRIDVRRYKIKLEEWNILGKEESVNCKSDERQTMDHLLKFPWIGITCDKNDIHIADDRGAAVAAFLTTETKLNEVKEK